MSAYTTSATLLEAVVDQLREKLSTDRLTDAERFVRAYYAGTALEDLAAREPSDLYGAALAHWNFAAQRAPASPKVRVYNPRLEQHGWQSTHTIIEIVVDDMPFLVDSVRMAFNERGLTTHLVVHPVINLSRDADGQLLEVLERGAAGDGSIVEAVMHCEVDRQTDKADLAAIHADVERALVDVRAAVEDWVAMREHLQQILTELERDPPPLESTELLEARAFLEWLDNNHFTFLGYREYELYEHDGVPALRSVAGSGLGLLRDAGDSAESKSFSMLDPQVRELAQKRELLVVTKANRRATVHRPGYMDYIGVKRIDDDGRVVGERRFLGLYTSAAYNRVPRDIPLLRNKVEKVIERAEFPRNSHAAKALQNILDTFPRDVLFQVPAGELYDTAIGILNLQERQRVRIFIHPDPYGRYYSSIVYVPRERFNTQVRRRIQGILEETLNGTSSEWTVQLSESVLARLYFVIRITPGTAVDYDARAIEERLVETSRSWSDDLYDALLEHFGEAHGTRLVRRYGEAFRADYRENYPARTAIYDVSLMENLSDERPLAMNLYRALEAPAARLQLRLFHLGASIPLARALPMLDRMGLEVEDEQPSKVKPAGGKRIWIHDFGMLYRSDKLLDVEEVKENFQDAFRNVWNGKIENDGFNRLVLRSGLGWREVVILRAYCKYLRQIGFTFSQAYIEEALARHADVAFQLVSLFHARFMPERTIDADPDSLARELETALDEITNLDEDRILRNFFSLIQATLRTNYYQTGENGEPKGHLSFKFDPARVPDLPHPHPMYEIFVYSPRVEGVHLRGGPVARGGLRWSDRREDFRTEVLGLVKAQMVKNAVIVPVGSKGGFVPKALPDGDRDAVQREAIACYQIFIRGMLDITDNLVDGEVVTPAEVVRYDGDDPYLVVAADKGTATFSDIANELAAEYGFWLGDAFASGGSQGYDHKKMGITARGAWESVKRHFRELGTDIQSTGFTVAGIGDMAGDVFGNGMLLSEHIRLVAAFNHLHIFLDPDPDPGASHRERARLFELPRSSWEDYDQSLVSKGGGVHSRSAKSISLTPEVSTMLGVEAGTMTPNELIRAILRAPVDLLWNGGIGTYVKASTETHVDVGDRANDAVRVDARELNCKVIGEGGNLGLTQLGRVECAMHGRRLNTDAIDNSGGVDCSDHEVNIKVLINAVVAAGDMTQKQRNALLVEMTEEVADLVLANNDLQTQALSVANAQAPAMLDVHARLMHKLEQEEKLDRGIEFLPGIEELNERAASGHGLTGPELSVLQAYAKITLFEALLDSDVPSDPFLARDLERYFPAPIRERFGQQLPAHRLAREIVATVVANGIVNRAGLTFAYRLQEETRASLAEITRAYLIAREVFGVYRLWSDVRNLESVVPAKVQTQVLLEVRKLVERAARWLLRNRPRPLDITRTVEYFSPGVATLEAALPELLPAAYQEKLSADIANLVSSGVPESTARQVAALDELDSALTIIEVADVEQCPVETVASIYHGLALSLDLGWLRDQVLALPREDRWQTLARGALRDELYAQQSALTAEVLRLEGIGDGAEARIEAWLAGNAEAVERCRQVLGDLRSGQTTNFAMLSVAMREIRGIRQLSSPGTSAAIVDIAEDVEDVHSAAVGGA